MSDRRPRGDGSLYWSETRQRWVASITVGYDGRGKRIVKFVSGRTKTEANNRLRQIVRDVQDGVLLRTKEVTVGDAVEDWLQYGLQGRSSATIEKYRTFADTHILPELGKRKLKSLTAKEVDEWLQGRSTLVGSDVLRRLHACLNRSVNRAMAREQVRKNVVQLVMVPTGRPGRPSKSLTAEHVDQVLSRTVSHRMHAYIVVSLLTGGRTEELRALLWENVHLKPEGVIPPHLAVWRSMRVGGDTKTKRSRRTLALPAMCVDVLRGRQLEQDRDRIKAGDKWVETGLVFTTRLGTELDAGNVRRQFRHALELVDGITPSEWTPREMRHSFVSVLSDAGVPLEEISRLVGHSGTAVTELVYRHQLRPVIQSGATVMDTLFQGRSHTVSHTGPVEPDSGE